MWHSQPVTWGASYAPENCPPEVEAPPDYSPVTHLPLILCTSPEDHHWDPPSQAQGRGTRWDHITGDTKEGCIQDTSTAIAGLREA